MTALLHCRVRSWWLRSYTVASVAGDCAPTLSRPWSAPTPPPKKHSGSSKTRVSHSEIGQGQHGPFRVCLTACCDVLGTSLCPKSKVKPLSWMNQSVKTTKFLLQTLHALLFPSCTALVSLPLMHNCSKLKLLCQISKVQNFKWLYLPNGKS